LRRSRISLPVLKYGTDFWSTMTYAPVRGLRPVRARRYLTENAPNPRSSTRSLRASAPTISSRDRIDDFFHITGIKVRLLFGMRLTSSDLIMRSHHSPSRSHGYQGIFSAQAFRGGDPQAAVASIRRIQGFGRGISCEAEAPARASSASALDKRSFRPTMPTLK